MFEKYLYRFLPGGGDQKEKPDSKTEAINFFKNRIEDIIIRSENEKDRDEWNRYYYALEMVEIHNRTAVSVFVCLYQDENHPLEEFEDYENRLRLFRLEKMKARILWAADEKDKTGYYEWGRDLAQLYKKLQAEQNAREFIRTKTPLKNR